MCKEGKVIEIITVPQKAFTIMDAKNAGRKIMEHVVFETSKRLNMTNPQRI